MLNVTSLSVKIGSKPVLNNITLSAALGDVTAIVGPNGSGKSTLLRAVTGEIPFAGQVLLDDLDVQRAKPWELAARRAVLPQSTPMSFPFHVIEVVRLGAAGIDRDTDVHARAALADVGLRGYETRFYQALSGGEQQRVQLARALCQIRGSKHRIGGRWLFLDEPVSSLDIAHQLNVLDIARRFAKAGGGVVMVMHDLNLTAMVSDKVVVMKDGQVAGQGSIRETLTSERLEHVYQCPVKICEVPASGQWFALPQAVAAS